MPMIERFKHTLTHSCGVGRGDSVLVCCSGGVDSMVLLRLMLAVRDELALKLHVVTVDHGLRCEAPGDAAFVLQTCRGFGIEASLYELGMDPLTPNLEETARLKRYEAIHDCLARLGMRYMATGHTLDDQAETLLYRLARGTGLKGMQGMDYARPDGLIRPMLGLTRNEVEAYARAHAVRFVTDQTNADLTLTRNLIRKKIMPLMRLINPAVEQSLGRFARTAREDYALIEDQALALQRQALVVDWRICRVFDAQRFMEAPTAVIKRLAMLQAAFMLDDPRGIEARDAEAVLEVLLGNARAHTLKRRVRVERSGDAVVFALTGSGPFYEMRVPGPGEYRLERIGQGIRIDGEAAPPSSPDSLAPPAERETGGGEGPLLIRSCLPGDTLADTKVARLLADKRVIAPLRRFWPVLVSRDALVAVAGMDLPGAPVEAAFPL